MNVLHFLPVYRPAWQYGGPVLSVSRLCEGLVEQGVNVRVITTNAGLPEFPFDKLNVLQTVDGVKTIYYSVDRHTRPIYSQALCSSLPAHMEWADILHMSSIWQPLGLPIQRSAYTSGVPVIQSLRGALGPYSIRRHWWKKLPYFFLKERPLLQSAAALHCTSNQEALEIEWLGLKPPVYILPNSMELDKLHYSETIGLTWRRRFSIPPSIPLLLVAGRFHHKKGLDLLPKVLQGVASLPWQIAFIGKDEDGSALKLRKQLAHLNLDNRCLWFDHMPADQLLGPYNSADCLLLPSRHENFGNVVIEALACGCGALISDRVGLAENLRSCPGVTIAPRLTSAWIDSLQLILSSKRPGSLSSAWTADTFSKSLIASQAINMYDSILNNA